MGRYILRYAGSAPAPAEHLERIRAAPKLRVIDESPKMVLVEADEAGLGEALHLLPGWSVHAEQMYPLPDTRKKLH